MVELAGIIILGIIAQWVAWRLKIPAILPLILIGLLVGPLASEYFGEKLIDPIWDPENNRGLFPDKSLYYFVSLAISVILFEGGLTLKRSEIKTVGPVITKLITVGALVTFFGAAISAYYILFPKLSWQMAFLFSALIIVTGPTVIAPILRNIPLKKNVSTVLKWEGILIDPIGALFAVLVYEFIARLGPGKDYTLTALEEFGKVLLFGFTIGFTFANALAIMIRNKWIPHYLMNVATLAMVLFVFVASDLAAHESGLLAVVVMGMVMGNMNLPNLEELLYFKESLSVLLISILFILLAANINMEDLELIYNWNTALLFAVIVFLIRPLGVLFSTQGSDLSFRERSFISWVGPRGIVAAGIASLFGKQLVDQGIEEAKYITPLVFTVVLGTVLLNATTARPVAHWLGVFLNKSEGILILGASKVSRLIADYLKRNDRHVVLIDNNAVNVNKAKKMGIEALNANIYSDSFADSIELNDIGYLFAMTGNTDINKYAIDRFRDQFGENGAYRLSSAEEALHEDPSEAKHLFSGTTDFLRLSEAVRKYPSIQEIDLKDEKHLGTLLSISGKDQDIVPLFLKSRAGKLEILRPGADNQPEFSPGSKLVYLGKVYDFDQEGV